MTPRCRWTSRAGFVIWSRQNRWSVFCLQGMNEAWVKLEDLLAQHKTLKQQSTKQSTADGLSDMDVDSPHEPSELPVDPALEACSHAIIDLMQAMYGHFGDAVDRGDLLDGFRFADIALAFGLMDVYQGILKSQSEVSASCYCC